MNINETFPRDCTVELKTFHPHALIKKKNVNATMSEIFPPKIYSRKLKGKWGKTHTEINLLIKIAVRGVVCGILFIYLFWHLIC